MDAIQRFINRCKPVTDPAKPLAASRKAVNQLAATSVRGYRRNKGGKGDDRQRDDGRIIAGFRGEIARFAQIVRIGQVLRTTVILGAGRLGVMSIPRILGAGIGIDIQHPGYRITDPNMLVTRLNRHLFAGAIGQVSSAR